MIRDLMANGDYTMLLAYATLRHDSLASLVLQYIQELENKQYLEADATAREIYKHMDGLISSGG